MRAAHREMHAANSALFAKAEQSRHGWLPQSPAHLVCCAHRSTDELLAPSATLKVTCPTGLLSQAVAVRIKPEDDHFKQEALILHKQLEPSPMQKPVHRTSEAPVVSLEPISCLVFLRPHDASCWCTYNLAEAVPREILKTLAHDLHLTCLGVSRQYWFGRFCDNLSLRMFEA